MTDTGAGTVLHTVIIETGQMLELATFYTRGLDLGDPVPTGDDHLGFSLPNLYFGFDLVPAARWEKPGAVSLWFEVSDLKEVYQRFLDLGAMVGYPPTKKPWGAVLAAVYDPDGNVVGLAQRGTLPDRV